MARRNFAAYGITWLNDFVLSLLVFAVTRSLAEQNAGTLKMGLVSGGFAAALSLSTFFGGRIADRLGHVKIIVAATLLLFPCLVCAAAAISGSWPFFLAYILSGLVMGMAYPAAIAWLTMDQQGSMALRRLIGYCLAWNLGMISGHATGGQLFGAWGHSTVLFCAAGILPLNLLLAAWGCKTVTKPADFAEDHHDWEAHGASVELAGAFTVLSWVANVGGTFAMSMILFLLPALAVEIGVTAEHQGGMVAVSRLVVIATYLLMAIARQWQFRLVTAVCSQLLAVLGLLYMAAARNESQLLLGLATFSMLPAYNYFASLFYSTVGSTVLERGKWCGIHEATLGVGLTLGSILGGWIGSRDVRSCFWLAAAVVSALTVVQLVLYVKLVVPLRAARANRVATAQRDWSIEPGDM